MALRLDEVKTTEDAGRVRPRGPACEAAIEQGIDLTLVEHNLALRPYERLRNHSERARFVARVQQRALPAKVRAARDRRELEAKLAAWDVSPDDVLELADDNAD